MNVLSYTLCMMLAFQSLFLYSQTCTTTPPVCVPANGYAFRYGPDTDFGLKFNTSTSEYQFTDASGDGIFNISAVNGRVQINSKLAVGTGNPAVVDFSVFNATSHFGVQSGYAQFDDDGDLTFNGTADYIVEGNRYAFRYKASPNYGIFFNETDSKYEFRTSNASSVFDINANTGDVNAKGNISNNGNITIRYLREYENSGRDLILNSILYFCTLKS